MTLERKAKTRLTTALVLLLVLGTGGVLGAALDRQLVERSKAGEEVRRDSPEAGAERRGRESGDRSRGEGVERRGTLLVEQVGLSELQKTQVDSVVAFYRREMRTLHEESNRDYMNRSRDLVENTRNDLRSLLTSEQQAMYDSLLAESDARWSQRRGDSVPGSWGRRDDSISSPRPRRNDP
ncbi:hypothetical protein ACFL0I_04355 [Gemmatimonadota bacterium]